MLIHCLCARSYKQHICIFCCYNKISLKYILLKKNVYIIHNFAISRLHDLVSTCFVVGICWFPMSDGVTAGTQSPNSIITSQKASTHTGSLTSKLTHWWLSVLGLDPAYKNITHHWEKVVALDSVYYDFLW